MDIKEAYLKNSNRCPICRSFDIGTIGPVETDTGQAWQTVSCMKCYIEWNDIYSLVDIEIKERKV